MASKGTERKSTLEPRPEWQVSLSRRDVERLNRDLVRFNLVRRGFQVWEACSHSCPHTFLIKRDGEYRRLNVVTGRRKASTGALLYPKPVAQDVLAVVIGDEITYRPSL